MAAKLGDLPSLVMINSFFLPADKQQNTKADHVHDQRDHGQVVFLAAEVLVVKGIEFIHHRQCTQRTKKGEGSAGIDHGPNKAHFRLRKKVGEKDQQVHGTDQKSQHNYNR